MKLLICGLPGTGKTTLAKKLFEEYKLRIVSDWDVFDKFNIEINPYVNKLVISQEYSNFLLNYINAEKENIVVDLEYSISPNDFVKYNKHEDVKIVYLGFVNIDDKKLFELFRHSNHNKKYKDNELMLKIKYYKEMSTLFKEQCDNNGLKFFDIYKERTEIQKEILNYLNIRGYINKSDEAS